MRDEITKSETVGSFLKRKGKLYKNKDGRVTTNTFRHCSDQQRGMGRVTSIGPRVVTKKITTGQILDFSANMFKRFRDYGGLPHAILRKRQMWRPFSTFCRFRTTWTLYVFQMWSSPKIGAKKYGNTSFRG